MASFWERIWRSPSTDWVFEKLEPSQVAGGGIAKETIEVDSAYIQITLQSMRVPFSRVGRTKFFGAVHCFCSVLDRRTETAEFHIVTTPTKLKEIDPDHVDHVVMGRALLLGPVVYRGGLKIDIGLFSVAATDLAAPYLALLETLSQTAGVAFTAAASPLVGSIKTGMELLAKKPGQAALEVGYTGAIPPETGHYILAATAKANVKRENLGISEDGHLMLNGQAVTTYPYLVFSVEAARARDDWFKIPDVAAPYREIRAAVESKNYTGAQEHFDAFRVACLLSNDLITEDARRLIDKVEAELKMVQPRTKTGGGGSQSMPELSSIGLYG
jgi:hypothetical protein